MFENRRKSSLAFFLENLKPHRRAFALIFILTLAGIATELLKPWPLKFVIDYLTTGNANHGARGRFLPEAVTESVTYFLAFITGFILLLALSDGLIRYFDTYLQKKTGGEIISRLRFRLFAHIQRLSLSFHNSHRSGELVNRITGDTLYLETIFSESISAVVKGLLQILGMATVMMWMDWQMMLVALVLAPLLFLIAVHFTRKIKKASRTQRHREGNLASIAQETISAIEIVKAYNRERYSDEVFQTENSANLQASLAATSVEAKFMPVVQSVTAVGVVIVVCFGILRVQAGVLTPGDLWVFLSYLKAFYRPLKDLSRQLRRLMHGHVRWEKITELLQMPSWLNESRFGTAPAFRGDIEFQNVNFTYGENGPVLKNVDLKIRAGEKIALIGPTGSGKSTLLSLLAQLYEPSAGKIFIDGQDIQRFNPESIREQMSFVLQDTLLFRTTIRENIAYGRLDASFEEIVAAARQARIHDFIVTLPAGYDTIVGERGSTLSGGQRQRLAVARAILRNSRIIILDEPTTGLDAVTESALWDEFTQLTQDRTTILVSHQPQLAIKMDRVYYLENGRLIEITEPEKFLNLRVA